VGSLSELDLETEILIKCITEDPQLIIDFGKLNWRSLLIRASINNVLYLFTKKVLSKYETLLPPNLVEKLKLIQFKGDEYIRLLEGTITFLSNLFSKAGVEFMVIKTLKALPYVTTDVDILVNPQSFRKAEAILKKLEYQHVSYKVSLDSSFKILRSLRSDFSRLIKLDLRPRSKRLSMDVHIMLPGLLRIDLYGNLLWQGVQYLDIDFFWKKPRERKIQGVDCLIPNLEAELALLIAHILNERRYITLLDFLIIKDSFNKVDWDCILEQSKKHGWFKSALRFISIINQINRKIYPRDPKPIISSQAFKFGSLRSTIKAPLSMPYIYSIPEAMEVFREWSRKAMCIPLYDILYFLWARQRFYWSHKQKVPVYGHWFDFSRIF
jgi:hypothetical protein